MAVYHECKPPILSMYFIQIKRWELVYLPLTLQVRISLVWLVVGLSLALEYSSTKLMYVHTCFDLQIVRKFINFFQDCFITLFDKDAALLRL